MLRFAALSEHGQSTHAALTRCYTTGVYTNRHRMTVTNAPKQLIPSRRVIMAPTASSSDRGLQYTGADTSNDAGSSSQMLQPTAAHTESAAAGTDATPRRRRDPAAVRTLPSIFRTVISPQQHKRADYAPGARAGGSVEVQLARQLRDLMKNPIPGISVAPCDNSVMVWQVMLAGPEGSPYAGGWFEVRLGFTHDFPGQQPSIRFVTRIWHPNVAQGDGYTCVALGETTTTYATGYGTYPGHSKVRSVACVLVALQMLLSTPNPHSTLNCKAGQQMLEDEVLFKEKARDWTRKYAVK